MRVLSSAPNSLIWLTVFVGLSVGITFAGTRHLLDVPFQAATRLVAPLQAGSSRVAQAAAGLVSGWQEVTRLRAENAALRLTVEELLQEAVRLRAAELENRELRDQLQYTRENQHLAPLPAGVIGFDSSALLGYAVIDRGSDHGLANGMTVVSPSGLVGRIVSMTARTSRVLLINHPSSSVNVVIQGKPGATGVADGQPDGRLLMRYIPQSEPIKVNDLVVTSGLGGAFPRNVAVGRVVHVYARDVDLFQVAIVEPFVNFRELAHVLVVLGFTPTRL